jgi:signal transduction histidine kinase
LSVSELPAAGKARALRLLVVDDDIVQRQVASAFLGMQGHVTVPAAGGQEALERLAAERFDLALVDVDMPGMSGLELLHAMGARGYLASMPVIMVTSRDDMAVIDRAFELGASDFTIKPVNWQLMQHEVRFVLRANEDARTAREARRDAEERARIKDQFLAIVRHELRSPMHALLGFGRLAVHATAADSAARPHLEAMMAASAGLEARLRAITLCIDLAYGAVASRPEAFTVAELVEDHGAAWRRRIEADGLAFAVVDDTGGMALRADPRHLAEAIARLIDNVVAHALGARQATLTARLCDGAIAITVADDGCGIAPERLAACLEPFSQAAGVLARDGEGLGLGLPIARGLVALDGGGLDLQAAQGAGTRATLTLPRAAEGGAGGAVS